MDTPEPLDYRTSEPSPALRWYEWLFYALCVAMVLGVVAVFIVVALGEN